MMAEETVLEFYGGSELRKFDQTCRLTIPVPFRNGLDKTAYVLKNIQSSSKATNCLIVYSPEEYLKFFERLESVYTGEVLAKAQRLVSANVDRVSIDKGGRISVKPEFMDFAELREDALIVCQPRKLEIWSPAKWNNLFGIPVQTEEDEGEQPDLSMIVL